MDRLLIQHRCMSCSEAYMTLILWQGIVRSRQIQAHCCHDHRVDLSIRHRYWTSSKCLTVANLLYALSEVMSYASQLHDGMEPRMTRLTETTVLKFGVMTEFLTAETMICVNL